MVRGSPPRVEPVVAFMLALVLVIVFIVILIDAWDVPTPICEQRILLPVGVLNGQEPQQPSIRPRIQCI